MYSDVYGRELEEQLLIEIVVGDFRLLYVFYKQLKDSKLGADEPLFFVG